MALRLLQALVGVLPMVVVMMVVVVVMMMVVAVEAE